MQRLNVAAMTALERSTLPKFIKAEAAIKALPLDESIKTEILSSLDGAYKKAQADILAAAFQEPKKAIKKVPKVVTAKEAIGKDTKVVGKGKLTVVSPEAEVADNSLLATAAAGVEADGL